VNAVYPDDLYLGRILAKLITPPHTASSVGRCLSAVENIDNSTPARLFVSPSSQTPMNDATRLSITTYPGPGCTPNEPMALVCDAVRSPLGGQSIWQLLSGYLWAGPLWVGRFRSGQPPESLKPFETQYSKCYIDKLPSGFFNALNCCPSILPTV
jgi:hypothetical protein